MLFSVPVVCLNELILPHRCCLVAINSIKIYNRVMMNTFHPKYTLILKNKVQMLPQYFHLLLCPFIS